ncbi:MAG TPA: metallophosphoesterase [Nitrospirota bacterium]|nr:metallophosphoesterase [Nitrospirota bacterium]
MNRRRFLKSAAAAGISFSGLAAMGEMFIPFAEAVEMPKFNFAHITDLHLDVRGESNWQYREKSVPLFIDALRQLGRLPKLKFVVFGGDQIHYGPNDKESLDVFQRWTAHLDMPLYILLGNTEVSPVSGVSKLGRDEYLKAWSGKGLRPGHSSWAFDPVSGVRVIGFDVTVDGKPYGEASLDDLKWLEKELKENQSKKLIVVFTHQLLMPTTAKDQTRSWSFWMVKNSKRVREVLEAHPNVRLVISGHHHVSKVETVGRITYVSDPAIVTYPCSFRSYSVSRAGIHLINIGLDDKAAVNRAKELLVSDPYAKMYSPNEPQKVAAYSLGLTDSDREVTLKL